MIYNNKIGFSFVVLFFFYKITVVNNKHIYKPKD